MPNEELRPTGALKDPEDKRDILFRSIYPRTTAALAELPANYSIRDELWFKVFRQKYGSCTAGPGRYHLQYFRHKWYGEKVLRSDRFIYGRNKEQDGIPNEEGSYPRINMMTIFGIGAPKLERWPQNDPPSPTHAEFIKSPPQDIREEAIEGALTEAGCVRVLNAEELKRAIYTLGPVSVSIRVLGTYDNDPSDGMIKPSDGSGQRGSHANWAIGWKTVNGMLYFEVANQWGENWADDGFAFIPLNYDPAMNMPLYDMWAVSRDVNASLTTGAPIELGYPVETPTPYVTQKFGARPEYYAQFGMKGHNGIDFRTYNIPGKYIIAADDGEVMAMNYNDGAYGRSIRLKHSWGMSIYAHNSQFLIEPFTGGDPTKVRKGQRIAIAGATGTDAEHCHFGIRINGVKNPGYYDWVDPAPYFKETSMTKFFRVQQGGTLGILVVEGFGGSLIWEDLWTDYQKLLQISGMSNNSPLILLPTGHSKFRVQDGSKAGILMLAGAAGGPLIFENDWTEYQTLLAISGMSMANPLINLP